MRRRIINILYLHFPKIFLKIFHLTIGKTKFSIKKNNLFNYNNSNMYRSEFVVNGVSNTIDMCENSIVECSKIKISGSNNKIYIGKDSFVHGLILSVEGDNNTFYLGNNFFICDSTAVAVIDGSRFIAGDGGMFSDNIYIRTSDSHSIIDVNSGKRINYDQDIILGNRVWLGHGVTLLKGAEIADDSIVGSQSVVTKKFNTPNTIIAGNPAKVVKSGVKWDFVRIK